MFRQDVTVVITDGMRVISTNCEQLENTLVQYYPIADVLVGGEQLTPDTLLQLKNDSGTWYGMFTQYRDYYLYAFFPSRVVLRKSPRLDAAVYGNLPVLWHGVPYLATVQ